MKMEAQIRLINVEDIIPNRFQPRLSFDEEALKELALSIQEHGIIQPLVLRRVENKFEIIAGERRYKAAQIAGLTQVPAIITNLDDNESAEVAIIENTHRKSMSAIEEAKSYKKLLDRKYVTQDQLAKRLGTSQSNVANKIRLLSLDENVQDALIKEKISERHARSLLKVTDKLKQVDLLNKVIEERWPVKRLDDEIDKILGTYKIEDLSGNIATNRLDVDVDDIVNKSDDIHFDIPGEYTPNYQYQGRTDKVISDKKNLFFNSLENEEVNMNPNINLGFNPFKTNIKTNDIEDDDIELLDLTGEEQKDEVPTVENEIIEEKITTVEEAEDAIKRIIKKAIDNNVALEMEEFNFDKMYQFVIRLDKDEKETN